MVQPKPPLQFAEAVASNRTVPYLLFAPPPAVARMKFVWLKTLKAFASNFMLTLSVILKILDRVISAYHWPGPTNVLRPRLPTHPKQVGLLRTGKLPCGGGSGFPSASVGNQPSAQVLWLKLLKPVTLLSGRSFLPRSRLKSPPTLWQFPSVKSSLPSITTDTSQKPFGLLAGSTFTISLNFAPAEVK